MYYTKQRKYGKIEVSKTLFKQHPEGEIKMRKIEYIVSDERLITPSGLSIVGQVLGKSDLIKKRTVCERTNALSRRSKTVMFS